MRITKFLFLLSCFLILLASTTALKSQNPIIANELIVQSVKAPDISDSNADIEVLSQRMGLYQIQFDDARQAELYLQDALLKESTLFAGYNYFVQFRDTVPPQLEPSPHWFFAAAPQNDVNAYPAWDIARGGVTAIGDTIVVAVIDDGVNINHPDLEKNIWRNYREIPDNGIDDDNNGYVDDTTGWNVSNNTAEIISGDHGTKVSGVIGASDSIPMSVVGASWNIKLMPICMGDSASVAEVIKAYEYILVQRRLYNESNGESGAFIVASNNSFGLRGFKYASAPYWCDFFDTLGTAGILSISSAPNSIFNIDEEGDLPTVCPSEHLVTAAGINLDGEWITGGISSTHIDIVAPGDRVSTTLENNSYGLFEGSSAAASVVSGLVGLLYSVECSALSDVYSIDPALANLQIRDLMLRSVDERPYLNNKTVSGGLIDYYESLLTASRPCDSCAGPETILADEINDTLVFSLLEPFDSLQWLIREKSSLDWDTIISEPLDTFYLPLNFGCDDLELAVLPYCDSTQGSLSAIFDLSPYKECGACALDYCVPGSKGSNNYWIERIAYSPDSAFRYTGNDLGYGAYSGSIFATYETDEANWVDIILEVQDTSLSFLAKIWMDVDHSGTFDPNEVVGESETPFDQFQKIDLDIPFTSLAGKTRMRIALKSQKSNEPLVPCQQNSSTSIIYEDHCVDIIVEDPTCQEIDSLIVLDREAMALDLSILPSLSEEESINVRYRKLGESEWDYETYDLGRFKIVGLAGSCTDYEVQARRVCGFDTSAYSATQVIRTDCPNSTNGAETEKLSLYPNPFQHSIFISEGQVTGREARVELLNALGQKVWVKDNIMIDANTDLLSNTGHLLQSGIYWIHIMTDGKVYTQKVMKAADRH